MLAVVAAVLGAAGIELTGLARHAVNLSTAAVTIASGLQYLVLAPRFVEWGPR
jgi:hypothetical protein